MATKLQAIIDFVYQAGGVDRAIGDMGKLANSIGQVGKSATQMSIESAVLDARTSMLSNKMKELSTAVAQNKMTVSAAESEYQKFEATLIKVPPHVDETKTALQRMNSGLTDAKNAWLAIATPIQSTIQILQQVGRTAKQAYEFISEGTQLSLAQDKFDALSKSIGTTADALLGDLKTATRGTISDAQLMASATSIMSLGLADTSEETVRLASLVGKLGWDMNQVTLTLANQSTMRLDSLGLSVSDVTDRVDALKAAGYSADQAFKFAILEAGEEKVKLLGDAADTTAGKLAILEANAANFKDSAQAAFSQELISNVNDLAGGLFESAEGASSFGEAFGKGVAAYLGGNLFKAASEQVDTLNKSTYVLANQSMPALERQLEQERAAMIASMTAIDDRREAIESHSTAIANAIPLIRAHATAVYQDSDAYAEFQDKLVQSSNHLSENEAMIATANARMVEWGETIPTVTGAIYASSEAIAAHNAATGDFATMAIQAGEEGVNLNQVMYDSLDAAGGSAEALVGLALATGQLTEAQAENILKQAAMIEYAQGLGEAIAAGTISISDAVTSLENFQAGLESSSVLVNGATGSVLLMNDAMVGSTSAVGSLQTSLDEFNTSNAVGATQAFLDKLNSIPRTVDVQVNVHGGGAGTNYGGGGYQAPGDSPGFAAGADFIVPPGYPNDSYPMRVQSGERVQVTPAGQSSGGNTYNLYVTAMDGGANVAREFNYMKAISNV